MDNKAIAIGTASVIALTGAGAYGIYKYRKHRKKANKRKSKHRAKTKYKRVQSNNKQKKPYSMEIKKTDVVS